jgi:hypothetical protein
MGKIEYSQEEELKRKEYDRVTRFIATRALKTDKRNLIVDENGYVNTNAVNLDFEKELTTGDINHRKLGFRFGAVRNISFLRVGLDSMYGFPYLANMVDASSNNISSINELPMCMYKSLDLSKNPITSLAGIHNKLKECTQLTIPTTVTGPLLGLLKIKGLKAILIMDDDMYNESESSYDNLSNAIRIMNKYLKDEKSTNILACQEALIDNDLKDFAEM